jgi:glycosyltransferase involved in cell wall biosynthesis
VSPKFSLIIPAHNEEHRIEQTLRQYGEVFGDSEIIVVLNGCTDGTEHSVRKVREQFPHIQYVTIQHAIGKGGAVRAGFLIARAPIVGFVDADGATPAREMRRLFESLGYNDGVIASRWLSGSLVRNAQPFARRIASRVFNGFVRAMLGLNYHDTQCGAKVFRAEALMYVIRHVDTSNMAFDVDLLLALKKAGYRVVEEPTEWNDVGGSRVRLVNASRRMLSALLRLRLRHSIFHWFLPIFDRILHTNPIKTHDGYSILLLNWRDPRHPQAGGAEKYVHEMAKRWVVWGNRVEWLTAGFKGAPHSETIDGIRVWRVGNALTVYFLIPLFYLLYLRGRFDVIVDAQNGIPFFSPLFSLKPKICLMHHVHQRVFRAHMPWPVHHVFSWVEAWLMPRVYRNTQFIAVSSDTRAEMLEVGFADCNIDVIRNGVDQQLVPGAKASTPLVLYLGRLKAYKRVHLLVHAMERVRAVYPTAKLFIAGDGDESNALQQLVANKKLKDCVSFEGFISEDRKRELLQKSWLLVNPSEMEGWGISVIEANACGTPALAYRVPGLREAVIDGFNGLLVPEGSDLAAPILRVLSDANLRGELCRGAVLRAAQFSWHATAERFLDMIMRNVAGDSFSMVRVSDHWRVIPGTGVQHDAAASHVPLVFRQVERI